MTDLSRQAEIIPGYFPDRTNSLSRQLWNIDWPEFLPFNISNGYSITLSSARELKNFLGQNSKKINTAQDDQTPFYKENFEGHKYKYFAEIADVFCFKRDQQIVGVAMNAPIDWCTYLLHYITILPEHRGNKLAEVFYEFISQVLRLHKVDKYEAEVSPSNQHQLQRMSRLGWINSGMKLSERFGGMIRLTKYISETQENIFSNQFCLNLKKSKTASSL